MVANGVFFRRLRRPMFWEQSAGLVEGERIWEAFRRRGGTVGILFWQQSLGENADLLLSPAPIHKHHGGMIQDCYSRPAGLYARLCAAVGRPFKLRHYWGPLASVKSGDWIADATAALLCDREVAPDVCLTYLPTLDYDLQRFGPAHERGTEALRAVLAQVDRLLRTAQKNGYEVLVFGDYAMGEVRGDAVCPNRALRRAGLLCTRRVRKMAYPDFYASRAFAMVDHETAHVYVADPADVERAKDVLGGLAGVDEVLEAASQSRLRVHHPNSGELVLVAEEGRWFAYPWWDEKREAPDYAGHVDIHNKPGYDPCELFFSKLPFAVGRDPARVRGSHGRVGPTRRIAWAATFDLGRRPATIIDLAAAVKAWLDEKE